MEEEQVKTGDWSRYMLPAAIGLLAVIVYCVTLNHWYSFASLTPAGVALGVDWWSFKVGHPLLYLVATPFRWLAADWQVIGLNALMAVSAAAVLALLARTVALLPQDRTHDQRLRNSHEMGLLRSPFDWLPPVFAVLLCGLQLSFWEHATVATGEMLYLLLFAFIIWSLAEYRIDRKEGRLWVAFVAYGLGMATNWAMIGFLPLFGLAVLWLKGFAFFRWRFLLSGAGLLLLGMLFYLYDPLMASLDPAEPTGFGKMLAFEWATQRNPLLGYPKSRVIILSITSVVPLLLVAIRWPANFGDVSGFGVALATLLFRFVHLVFLAAIVWVAFDPVFSPRALGYGLPMLTFYFLGALAAGYLTGYFLLIGSTEPPRKWQRSGSFERLVTKAMFVGIWAAVLVVPVLLIRQNLPRIRVENGDLVHRLAGHLAARLPKNGAFVLGTDLARLQLINAWQHGRAELVLLASMPNLGNPRFHKRAAARYPGKWPDPGNIAGAEPISIAAVVQFLSGMSRVYPLWSVDPLAGTLLLESVDAVPRGMVNELRPVDVSAPVDVARMTVPPDELKADFDLIRAIAESLKADLLSGSAAAEEVGRHYSAWVNSLGVSAQMGGDLEGARWAFMTALGFNTNNVSARINSDVNVLLAETKPGVSTETDELQQELAQTRSWSNLLRRHGPIDESRVRTFFGELLLGNSMHRQSLRELGRALELNRTNVVARLDLGRAWYEIGRFTNSLTELEILREPVQRALLNPDQLAELERLTALNEYRQGRTDAAEKRLLSAVEVNQKYLPLRDALVTVYVETKRFTNALPVIEEELRQSPEHRRARFNLGPVYASLGRNEEAIRALTELLQDETNNASLYANRAAVHLKSAALDAAEADYRKALEINYVLPSGYLGLADVSLQRKDTNAAISNLEMAVKLLPATDPQGRAARLRLQSLQGGKDEN